MYCRNCGQKMADGDKFCSSCGARAVTDDNTPVTPTASEQVVPKDEPMASVQESEAKSDSISDDAPLFEPFDFKAFGFDFSELGLGSGVETNETESKPTPPTEEFDWNTGEFPDRNTATKTEEVNFNWSLTPEEAEAPKTPEAVIEPEEQTAAPDEPEKETPKSEPEKDVENSIFEDLDNKADETRMQSEEIDKFFTFHKKNEEFQRILDREYEKVKSGNIIADELSAAEAGAEEKFVSRKPEDPMEDLFASEGIIRGYEPKPVETDVLERIEAAEEEKRVREEAARLIEEQKEKERLEAEAVAKKAAEEAEAAAAAEAMAATEEGIEEPVEAAEAEELRVEQAEETQEESESPVEEDHFDIFEQLESIEIVDEEQQTADEIPAEETPSETESEEIPAEDDLQTESEQGEAEEAPVKTKAVDKAAILAGMAIANEMVERDRSIMAEQAAEAAEAAEAARAKIEQTNIELPDFLGHEDVAEQATEKESVAAPEEPETDTEPGAEEAVSEVDQEVASEEESASESETPAAEQEDIEESSPEDVEVEIFEQLENAQEEENVEEIALTDSQTLVDLFADAETVENHEKGFTQHTLIISEDSVADILDSASNEPVIENTTLFTAETLGAILAEAEQENPDASEVVVSVESLKDVPAATDGDTENVEDEEDMEEKGGKGRVVLKVLLVILIILLVMEVAGVVIKIAAPTSGAANFIDDQLNKVFQLISGEDNKELSVFAEAEEIRTEPLKDKTELIAAEKGKNKNGNIGSIVYNGDLAFDVEKKYENTDLDLTQDLTDVTWYKDANNKQVYYDQAIVGAIIAYDSQRVNLINNNDVSVLDLIVDGTPLYSEVQAGANGATVNFEELQIGEIRQSGSSYFVWTAETINGKTDTYIYEMQPEGETMKIKARYAA